MNNVDYMQNVKGNIVMFCEQLPDKGFIDIVKVRNICTAKIFSVQDKKANNIGQGPDVELVYASGERNMITRQELMKNFIHCSGKRITLRNLRSNYRYCVFNMNGQGETYKALRIPDNCTGNLGGKEVKPGSYIVCKANQDGTVNKDTMTVMSRALFRKSFKIPIQSVIKRHMDKPKNTQFGLYNPNRLASVRGYHRQDSVSNIERTYAQNTQPKHQINMGTGLGDTLIRNLDTSSKPVSMPSIQSINTPRTQVQTPGNSQQKPVQHRPAQQKPVQHAEINDQTKTGYKYTITHRIISPVNTALLGFVVKEISSNKSKQLTTQQVMQLCEKKLVDNVILVSKDNGMKYLKGNNMRLESLPQVIG